MHVEEGDNDQILFMCVTIGIMWIYSGLLLVDSSASARCHYE